MEEKQEKSERAEEVTVEKTVEATPTAAVISTVERERVTTPRRSRTATLIVVAVFGLAAAALLFWWLNRSGGGAGRVVTAPRNVNFDQPTAPAGAAAPAPGEATLTVAPEVAARAGIRVEAVGEQLAPEALQQAATGVVQANAYRSTPVVTLVGGRLVSVSAEAGQEVRRGQTVAVVFSDELAMAQTRYLSAQADLEEHHQHHARTAALIGIGAASREEFEQATSVLRKAEAELASLRQRLLLLGL